MSHPLLFTQNENGADGYWCIYVSLLTDIVTLPITSPRSHPFEIFRAKRLFGVLVFYNSALIRLQKERIMFFPSLAFKLYHNKYNSGHTICATSYCTCDSINCLQLLHFLLSPHIVSHWESHTAVKVSSLQLISTLIHSSELAGFVFLAPHLSFTSWWYKF